jgi:hypothetical protein
MLTCEVCGNEYDKPFEIVLAGKKYVFDSLECAITRLVPSCKYCGCRVIGQSSGTLDPLCCPSCASTRFAEM